MRLSPRDHLDEVEGMLLKAVAELATLKGSPEKVRATADVAMARITLAQAATALPALELSVQMQGKTGEFMDAAKREIDRGL